MLNGPETSQEKGILHSMPFFRGHVERFLHKLLKTFNNQFPRLYYIAKYNFPRAAFYLPYQYTERKERNLLWLVDLQRNISMKGYNHN